MILRFSVPSLYMSKDATEMITSKPDRDRCLCPNPSQCATPSASRSVMGFVSDRLWFTERMASFSLVWFSSVHFPLN